MKVNLDGTDKDPFDPATDLRVLVAYQNAASALRAKAMLQRPGQASGEQSRLPNNMWNLKSRAEPVLLPIATEEALAADIIMFSAQARKSLPKTVRD